MTDVSAVEVDQACALPQPRLPLTGDGTSTFFGQFGHAPGLIEGWLAWYQPMMLHGRVPTRTKELCRLAVAGRTGCHMCQNGRFPDVTGTAAVADDDAERVIAGDFSTFTDTERAALAWTIAYWDDHTSIPEDVVDAATDALGYDGFLEVALMVAQFTGMGRLFSSLGMTTP